MQGSTTGDLLERLKIAETPGARWLLVGVLGGRFADMTDGPEVIRGRFDALPDEIKNGTIASILSKAGKPQALIAIGGYLMDQGDWATVGGALTNAISSAGAAGGEGMLEWGQSLPERDETATLYRMIIDKSFDMDPSREREWQ